MIQIGILMFSIGIGWAVWVMSHQLIKRAGAYEERYLAAAHPELDSLLVFIAPQDLLKMSRAIAMVLFPVSCLLFLRLGAFFMIFISCAISWIGFILPRSILRLLLVLRRKSFLLQFPDALGMLNNGMKAGLSLMQALEMVAKEAGPPVSQEIFLLCKDRQMGRTLDDSLDRLAQRVPLPDVRIFIMVLKLSNRMGGNVTDALGRLAETIRNRFVIEKKIKSLTAEARMQAIVMCALPFLMFLAFLMVAPEMMKPLTSGMAGAVILGLVLVLEIFGGFFMWKCAQIKY